MEKNENITLVSSSGEKFTANIKIKEYCQLFALLLDGYGSTNEDIPVEIKPLTLKRIIEFFEHHQYNEIQEIPKPLPKGKLNDFIPQWDFEYINSFNEDELYELLTASSYIQCKNLYDLVCSKIACTFRDIKIEDLKDIYGGKEELDADLEMKIRNEYPYLFVSTIDEVNNNK